MTEIKLSQGAKPGYGGLLPAQGHAGNRRCTECGGASGLSFTKAHSAFKTPLELLEVAARMRDLSGGNTRSGIQLNPR